MQLSQPTLEPHSLCYTCWVQVVYSLLPTLLFSSCPLWGHPTAAQFLATQSSHRATRSTSRRSSPSRCPCGAQLPSFVLVLRFCILCIRHFVINEINNIRIHFIISFYVICAVIFCSFCCIYVWLDPGTYMIARFMSFYKPGVTGSYDLGVCDPSCELWLSWVIHLHRLVHVSWLCFIFLNWAL